MLDHGWLVYCLAIALCADFAAIAVAGPAAVLFSGCDNVRIAVLVANCLGGFFVVAAGMSVANAWRRDKAAPVVQ